MSKFNYIIELKGTLLTQLKPRKFKVYIEDATDEAAAIESLKTQFKEGELIAIYQQMYKVIVIQRKSGNRKTYKTMLTRSEAQRIVKSFPSYANKMYCFDKIYTKTDFTIYCL